jgi:hypothetical protein
LPAFLGFGKKHKDARFLRCVSCNKELGRHKYKPSPEWNMQGLLCSDCHVDKTRDFTLKAEADKRQELEQKDREERTCNLCNSLINLDSDKKRPDWRWNMDSGIVFCPQCYDKSEAEFTRKLNFCAICGKKIGFIRYNPKRKWAIDGQLCRRCWDERNVKVQKIDSNQ